MLIALAIWSLGAFVRPPAPKDLFFPASHVLLFGASGLLLWFRRYRWLAKLWIAVFAIILQRRITAHERSPEQLLTWDEVLDRLRDSR